MEGDDMTKPHFTGPDDNSEKKSMTNYIHSYQKTVCIGHVSLAPDITTIENIWNNAWGLNEAKIPYTSFFGHKKMDELIQVIPREVKKIFLNAVKPYIFLDHETQRKELINRCFCFELGENRTQKKYEPDNLFLPTEPDKESVLEMVTKWMDKVFEQAEILRAIKLMLLEPLIEQIEAISEISSSKRKGEHAKVLRQLERMTKVNYIFGYVYKFVL